jgi:hypothetical protein
MLVTLQTLTRDVEMVTDMFRDCLFLSSQDWNAGGKQNWRGEQKASHDANAGTPKPPSELVTRIEVRR